MVTLLDDFQKHLISISAVSTAVGAEVYPTKVPDVGDRPESYIVYTVRDGIKKAYYKNTFGVARYAIQIDIWTKSFLTNQTMSDAIIGVFNGFSGKLNNNTIIGRADVVDHSELFGSGTDSDYFRTVLDVELYTT